VTGARVAGVLGISPTRSRAARPVEDRRLVALGVAAVLVLAPLVVVKPLVALAAAGAVALVGVAVLPPEYLLAGVVFLTAVVPYGVQKSFGIGGGPGSPGLLLSDVLLLASLLRAVPRLLNLRLHPRVRRGVVLVIGFLAVAAVQFGRGVFGGRNLSTVGYEFRVLLGFATFLVVLPILADTARRRRFVATWPLLGLLLGLWGIGQWVFNLQFSQAADAGVRAGVRLTSSGRGQLQGGLFAFPVAILVALAAVVSGEIRSFRLKLLLVSIVALNVVCLVLTYERSFWVATTLAAGFVVLKSGAAQRLRAVFGGAGVLVVSFASLATLAPKTLVAARERLLSLSQFGSDFSVKYRVAESHHVVQQITAHPVIGSGLGASIFFGRPWDLVPPQSYTFSHNGYLWLAWRLGVPAASSMFVLLLLAIRPFGRVASSRGPLPGHTDDRLLASLQNGTRGALVALALTSVTFPSFNQLGITATMGVLMAVSLWEPASVPSGYNSSTLLPLSRLQQSRTIGTVRSES
jgi:hypothetical protein